MLATLSSEQELVVYESFNNNLIIRAGAGSGKTFTILCRILMMIESGISEDSIMITTFTVQAARDIKSRLFRIFDRETSITVGTIDSISRRLLSTAIENEIDTLHVSEYSLKFYKLIKENQSVIKQFKYLFVDEFQDLNQVQYNMVQVFYKNGVRITAVGDEQQNIYSFRGGDGKFMNEFRKLKDVKELKLGFNFRSTKELVEFGNEARPFDIFQTESVSDQFLMDSNDLYGAKPMLVHFDTVKKQNDALIDYIQRLIENGIQKDEICILCPQNQPLYKIEELLTIAKIDYVLLERVDSFQRDRLEDHICLSTIHKSKGLEWDVVFMVGMEDLKMPLRTDPKSLAEAKRLFYVGVTRAKKSLSVCYTGKLPATRFMTEISTSKFDTNKDHEEILVTNIRKYPQKTLDLVLKQLNSIDYDYLRTRGIIPTFFKNVLYQKQKLNSLVHDEYLYEDFEYFIQTFIIRSISRWLNLDQKDQAANKILTTSSIYENLYINHNSINKTKTLKPIFPKQFQKRILKSVNEYQDYSLTTTDIIDSIFNLSICYTVLLKKRLRVFYKDIDGTTLYKGHLNLFKGVMELFIKPVIKEKKISLRGTLKHKKYPYIKLDYHIKTEDTIYYILCSGRENVDAELLLSLLLSKVMAKQDGDEIRYIKVFNPVMGIVFEYDLIDWDFGDALIEFINSK
jgi:superfamily I DNA/RNA helicase